MFSISKSSAFSAIAFIKAADIKFGDVLTSKELCLIDFIYHTNYMTEFPSEEAKSVKFLINLV